MYVKNEFTGETKKVKNGFSWTFLFFGPLVPLVRGDFKWFLLSVLLAPITIGISSLYLVFKYNSIYMKELHLKGFKGVSI